MDFFFKFFSTNVATEEDTCKDMEGGSGTAGSGCVIA
jgi:hypothetical protein